MKSRRAREIRPVGELMEGRLLAASWPSMRGGVAEWAVLRDRPGVPGFRTPPRPGSGVDGPGAPIRGGFPGGPALRDRGPSASPTANVFYGLVTIRNTTQANVAFSISASTYQGGRYFNFTLGPGQRQVYFASYDARTGTAPIFKVSFDTVTRRNVIMLPEVRTQYAPADWVPTDPNLGSPYAIVAEGGRLNVIPVRGR
ncbi:hypothetical protein [Paludisphaera soli]|uniref:hypothetical protein n=1 Tax=Paludisphaera soli TaxID=2712865 RepID=UPI0013EA42A3|nr:hypothetical protein [Paludisphaera soli]